MNQGLIGKLALHCLDRAGQFPALVDIEVARQFLLRGSEKVRAKWALICIVHNLNELATLAWPADSPSKLAEARPIWTGS